MSYRLEFVYGYHGCCKSVADSILSGLDVLLSSDNDYDWLGTGIYFWEEAPARAYEWAKNLGLPYDTVRCPFPEGEPVFPGSTILDRSHIQISVRNQAALAELFAVDIASFEGRCE